MSTTFLTIGRLERQLTGGKIETLHFEPGVNLLVGPPNTGKTKWLDLLDFLLGDPSSFEASFNEHIVDRYNSAKVELFIGDEQLVVERKWKEAGTKTKVFVNDVDMSARDFQHLLMERLGFPLLHFPKGNPLSGQTWPELSFRMLLRHVYRQQRFWGGLADQQPDGEQHACLLQFLGLAERTFSPQYGELVSLKLEVETLKSRREHYRQTLDEIARDVLSDPDLQVAVTHETVNAAEAKLKTTLNDLRERRLAVISAGRDEVVPDSMKGRIEQLSQERAELIVGRELLTRRIKATSERREEMCRYRQDLTEEAARLERAKDAGTVLADLRITHCPACDQSIDSTPTLLTCHLCHQDLPDEPMMGALGTARLQFEQDRLGGELKEAEDLLSVLNEESGKLAAESISSEQRLRMVENELAPARQAVSALVNEELSALDMALGELNERQRQVSRLKGALDVGKALTENIAELERQIVPLQDKVDAINRGTDFGQAEELLADGMNAYLNAIHRDRDEAWRHSGINVDITRSNSNIKVGSKRWHTALGGTDTLYFLMSYHFALLSLSDKIGCHYPGISIIDLPGDFLGTSIEDKENFIVQPFIDLLARPEFATAQVIISGASFKGLVGAHRQTLTEVYVG